MSTSTTRVYWFLGLPASGKTTLSRRFADMWRSVGRGVVVLDGDDIRRELHYNLGFTSTDRYENVTRTAKLATLIARQGVGVVVAMITPERDQQEAVREIIPKLCFIHCRAELSVLEARDPKGHYAQARASERRGFTGVDAPFDVPLRPHIEVRTDQLSETDCIAKIYTELQLSFLR